MRPTQCGLFPDVAGTLNVELEQAKGPLVAPRKQRIIDATKNSYIDEKCVFDEARKEIVEWDKLIRIGREELAMIRFAAVVCTIVWLFVYSTGVVRGRSGAGISRKQSGLPSLPVHHDGADLDRQRNRRLPARGPGR